METASTDIIGRLCSLGNLLHNTMRLQCLAIDLVSEELHEIPENHLEDCFCKQLARMTGEQASISHLFTKCRDAANINSHLIYACPFELANIIVPIFRNGVIIAALQAGPILTKSADDILQRFVLSHKNITGMDLQSLKRNLASLPKGDIDFLIALAEMMSILVSGDAHRIRAVDMRPRSMKSVDGSVCSDVITSAIQYISANYADHISLEDVAKNSYVHPAHLSRVFGKQMNCHFREYINELRIDRAKELLEGSNLSIAEISNQVGFTDQSYFNKIFKKAESVTPSQYRKICLGDGEQRAMG